MCRLLEWKIDRSGGAGRRALPDRQRAPCIPAMENCDVGEGIRRIVIHGFEDAIERFAHAQCNRPLGGEHRRISVILPSDKDIRCLFLYKIRHLVALGRVRIPARTL